MKIKEEIKIGNEIFFIELEKVSESGVNCISVDEQIKAQRALGLKLVKERRSLDLVSPELINFLFNISGMSVVDIARYLSIEASDLSSWRREGNTPNLGWWLVLRIFLIDLFENGSITLGVLRDNFASVA